jgi:phosphoserine phosphatase RsbU/P
VLILAGYVLLVSHLAQYSRTLFVKLVSDELTVRNQKELTDLELNIASQVQSQFLPGSIPEIRGLELYGSVQQGKYVGGDYYDFIRLSDDRLLVVIADVSGNGVPAALIMAEVRASTHLLASLHLDLEALAQQINLLIHQSTDKKSFVTFCAAEVNTHSRLLRYINAGHPPPLVFSNGSIHALAKGTIPLGVCASLPLLTTHVEEFPSGSILVSYTDGLLEQVNSQEEQFIRTNGQLNAPSMTKKLLSEIKSFASGQELNDDVGLAVVKFLANSSA